MKRLSFHKWRRFLRNQSGQIAIEFTVLFPILFSALLIAIELGLYTLQQTMLDRALDLAVREVRVDSTQEHSHASIKRMICDNETFFSDCDTELMLELSVVDPRGFSGFSSARNCADRATPVNPMHSYNPSNGHALMLVRACYVFDPIFPVTRLWQSGATGTENGIMMTSTSVFVQETG